MSAACAPATRAAPPTPSAEVYLVPLEPDRFLVYAPLRQAAFVANARAVNFLADLKDGRHDPQADPEGALTELLRRLQIVDGGPEEPPIGRYSGDPAPTSVTLFLTTACNLRCTYCYASAGDTPLRSMSLETACRGVDFVAENAARLGAGEFEVNYHGGGEPTVNWKVLTGSHEHAHARGRELGLAVRSSSATNGVLSDAQIDWVIAHLDGVSLSFDGLPAAHDLHRPLASGKGSAERVMRTLSRFDQAGYPYGIRVTVTADQLPRMADSVEFICSRFKPERIQVEPAYPLGRWASAPSAETEGFIAGFREAQARAARHGQEIHFSAARLGTLTSHFCGITQDTFALSPDGNVSACYEAFSEDNRFAGTFFYGRPARDSRGYDFQLPVLERLRDETVDRREFCRGCFARWTCAGDCLHRSLAVNGPGPFQGSDRCHITRALTRDQVLARIARSGGLFWHEPPGDPAERAAGKEFLL